MTRGKNEFSSSSILRATLMPVGSSSATAGERLAISSKLTVLSSPWAFPYFFSSFPYELLYLSSAYASRGSISFLISLTITIMRKKRTIRKQRKTVPRCPFWPWVFAIWIYIITYSLLILIKKFKILLMCQDK